MVSRRDFLRGGAALVSIGTVESSFLKGVTAFAGQHPFDIDSGAGARTLILIQLAGGNDGLDTVAPVGDGAYKSARPTLRIDEGSALPLEQGLSLHPSLAPFKGLYDDGKLGVVLGVGYPNQNYSHFKSMAIWQSADPEGVLNDGWLGRALDELETEQHDPFLGFKAGGTSTPPELRGAVPVSAVTSAADYGFKVSGQAAAADHPRTTALMRLYDEYPTASPYGVLIETTVDTAVESSALLSQAHADYTPMAAYPQTSLASSLQLLAEVIVGGLGMRVGHVTIGGWDTHASEGIEHPRLLQELSEAMSAFYADLEAHGKADDVLVLTWSEFGRRPQENASGGTDHGAASVLFALGSGVHGGLYGEYPNLTNLVDNGNLGYTVDFRQVYATVLDNWLGVPSAPLLGQQWPVLGFV